MWIEKGNADWSVNVGVRDAWYQKLDKWIKEFHPTEHFAKRTKKSITKINTKNGKFAIQY